MAPVINLNNEVVKMRKDVKKVKVFTIRKLTRQMSKLKSKKGTDELIQKNQRRAQRLLEEIYTIKKLKPDDVTKTALRNEINFEEVCKKPDSSIETRTMARLAMHPILKQKISTIKDAVKAFKEARKSKVEETFEQNNTIQSSCTETKKQCKRGKTKEKKNNSKPEHKSVARTACKTIDTETNDTVFSEDHEGDTVDFEKNSQAAAFLEAPKVSDELKPGDCAREAQAAENRPEDKESGDEKKTLSVHETDSDIEDSDKEEKEYFDDSTEERFYKQVSDFDESDSDSDGDFFIGKVRRTKKTKSSKNCSEDKVEKDKPLKESSKSSGQSETHKSITALKTVKLQSVFCSSLADTKQKSSFMKRENKPFPIKNKKAAIPQVNKLAKNPQPVRNMKAHHKLETALHPSWEASKKRKVQSQIAKFQGKKIVFDD